MIPFISWELIFLFLLGFFSCHIIVSIILQALKFHLFKHADLRPYQCDECHDLFRTPSTLNAHFTVQHSISKHKCSGLTTFKPQMFFICFNQNFLIFSLFSLRNTIFYKWKVEDTHEISYQRETLSMFILLF